jgi:hypothetical protein
MSNLLAPSRVMHFAFSGRAIAADDETITQTFDPGFLHSVE